MQAYADGKKIEVYGDKNSEWIECVAPAWDWLNYDYRIKTEPKYRPYANAEECFKDVQKHGGWVKDRYAIRSVSQITIKEPQGIMNDLVQIRGCNGRTYEDFLSDFVWADNGTPCGVLEEE